MNKKILVSLIAGTVMMSTSIASMAAANPVGTHNTTVSGSFVSPTCMVTEWPQDISFDLLASLIGAIIISKKLSKLNLRDSLYLPAALLILP